MMTIGIDPGTATIGYGLVRELADGSLQAQAYGVITTPAGMPMPQRLRMIFDQLTELITVHQPDRAAVEDLFFGRNITTGITVAQGRGVILLTLEQAGLPIYEYKPAQIKQSMVGHGTAKKPQVQEMVRMLLSLESIPKPDDAADALAVAITDLHSARYNAISEDNTR